MEHILDHSFETVHFAEAVYNIGKGSTVNQSWGLMYSLNFKRSDSQHRPSKVVEETEYNRLKCNGISDGLNVTGASSEVQDFGKCESQISRAAA